MQTEIIYLWVNQDTNGCFHSMGFNFSPIFNISYDYAQSEIHIERTRNINVLRRDNLSNITAVIGENGTGKTTLLQYITSLACTPLGDAPHGYEEWQAEQNEYIKYIAIYCEEGNPENIKIINNTAIIVYWNGVEIMPCRMDADFGNANYIGNISHVFISNSEYTENRNLRSDAINNITLANNTLNTFFREFYFHIFNAPDGAMINDTSFNALQSIISSKMNTQTFQMILDLMYQFFIQRSGTKFCGKTMDTVSFSMVNLLKLIPQEILNIHYTTQYASLETIQDFHRRAKSELRKIVPHANISQMLMQNLMCELVFIYNFTLNGTELLVGDIDAQCQRYIETIPDEDQKSYYSLAIEEIHSMQTLITDGRILDDLLPENDLGRQIIVEMSILGLWQLIERSISSGRSFILKYLRILNFEMSSGERVLLNFMSRIYFASQMQLMLPDHGFQLHENVLLLIDEIDLYLHPEWQRRIIVDLLRELRTHFQRNHFQIILTSHSPIVLSDIPCENTIFLMRKAGEIVQIKRDIQTFGANIHLLYKDAFFIKNGLAMGEYAQEFINQLISDIRENRISREEAEDKIAIIGEPIIKKKLYQILGHPQPQIERIPEQERQQMVDFLIRQKTNIERQIATLSRR